MAYTIAYTPDQQRKYPLQSDLRRKRHLLITFLCLLIAAFVVFLSPACSEFRDLILPDGITVAEEAIAVFSDELAQGESAYNALQSFCRFILKHA